MLLYDFEFTIRCGGSTFSNVLDEREIWGMDGLHAPNDYEASKSVASELERLSQRYNPSPLTGFVQISLHYLKRYDNKLLDTQGKEGFVRVLDSEKLFSRNLPGVVGFDRILEEVIFRFKGRERQLTFDGE